MSFDYEDEYEFDYDRIAEDADELYEYADYSDEPDDYNESEYEHYYHNIADEIEDD